MKNSLDYLIGEEEVLVKRIRSLLHFKFLFRFKYPKLLLFIVCIVLSYLLFSNIEFDNYLIHLGNLSYFGVLVAGILFSFGFTSPFSAGILILINPENIILAALIGGVGSLLGDILIFKFVKVSFEKEFLKLKKEKPFLFVKLAAKKVIKPKFWHYLLFVLAGFFFASPFIPDEAAIILIAGIANMNLRKIAVISFVCNTLGVLFFLSL